LDELKEPTVMKKLFFAIITALAVVGGVCPAFANPAYLSCDVRNRTLEVTVDEERGTMVISPNIIAGRATFTANAITLMSPGGALAYRVDRVSLQIQEAVYLSPSLHQVTIGQCTKEAPPVRQI
jgi:hypothetical protein